MIRYFEYLNWIKPLIGSNSDLLLVGRLFGQISHDDTRILVQQIKNQVDWNFSLHFLEWKLMTWFYLLGKFVFTHAIFSFFLILVAYTRSKIRVLVLVVGHWKVVSQTNFILTKHFKLCLLCKLHLLSFYASIKFRPTTNLSMFVVYFGTFWRFKFRNDHKWDYQQLKGVKWVNPLARGYI